jgi:hypothetical protein
MFFFIKQRGEKIVSLREDEKISIGEQPFEAFLQLVEIGWLPSASQCSPGCKTIFSAGFFRSRRVAKLFASPSCETFTANSGEKDEAKLESGLAGLHRRRTNVGKFSLAVKKIYEFVFSYESAVNTPKQKKTDVKEKDFFFFFLQFRKRKFKFNFFSIKCQLFTNFPLLQGFLSLR